MAGRQGSLGSTKEQLASVFKLIKEAQTLDGNGDELGAYRHYLAAVAFAAQTLSNDIQANQGQGTLSEGHATQLFKMGKQCLEQGEAIYTTAKKEKRPLALFRLSTPSPATSPPPIPDSHNHTTPSQLTVTRPQQYGIGPSRTMSWPARSKPAGRGRGVQAQETVDGSLVRKGPTTQYQTVNSLHQFSYMEEARLKNQHMMEQYKAHLRQSSSQMLPSSYHDAGLSMLRRLEENVGVARIRQQMIARKLRERELRLKQEEAKNKRKTLSSLSIEELCEEVSTFERGKGAAVMNKFKARLNTTGSDQNQIYNILNEILSIADHPLTKLLGEYQYSIYMMLQPVGSAVEKAGGLPRLEIQLDNCGMDRKPSEDYAYDEVIPTSPKQTAKLSNESCSTQSPHPSTDDESHLDLLCGDEDDDLFNFANPAPQQTSTKPPSSSAAPPGTGSAEEDDRKVDPFDEKLAQLRSSLLWDDAEGHYDIPTNRMDSSANRALENGVQEKQVYENLLNPSKSAGNSDKADIYMNLQDFNLDSNNVYSVMEPTNQDQPTVQDESEDRGKRHSIYDNAAEISDYLKEQGIEEVGSHMYEVLDGFVAGESGQECVDGAMMSRPPPLLNLQETVMFKNLPPLICRSQLGDECGMTKLADTASSVLKAVVKDIHVSFDKLEQCLVECYPVLDSEDNRQVCHTVLEICFFPPILKLLVMVFRCKNYLEEVATAKNMCQLVNATPRDFSVRNKFWLIDQSYAPYGEAIDELRKLPTLQCPTPKLECLVHLSKSIVQCIDDYYEAQGKPKGTVDSGVGVDDILPIMSYVIVRSGLPELVSECSIMEEFIQDGYMKGEEGFCLTSFLTALKYVSKMSS